MDPDALDPHQRQSLHFALLGARQLVAAADGRVSPLEAEAFDAKLRQVARLEAAQATLVRAVAVSLLDDRERVERRFADATAGGLTPAVALGDAKAVLDGGVDPVQATTFRHVVQLLCGAVAEAAPLVGEAVTAQEAAAIDEVVRLLA